MKRTKRNKITNKKLLMQRMVNKSCKTKKYKSVYGARMTRALFF